MKSSQPEAVPYGKLYRWGWRIVRPAAGPFFLATFGALFKQVVLTQFTAQVLATVISDLARRPDEARPRVVLGTLMPETVSGAFLLFVVLTVALLLSNVGLRLLNIRTDGRMLLRLREQLHDRLLTLGPRFHATHQVGETTLVVRNYAQGAQVLLRELIAAPFVQGLSIITAVLLLLQNLGSLGAVPPVVKITLGAALIALPVLVQWLSGNVGGAFRESRDADLVTSEQLHDSLSQPLEIQAMGARGQRAGSFSFAARRAIRAQARASSRNELAIQLQSAVPTLLQVGFLAYGVVLAMKQRDPAAAGALVAIYSFVPLATAPVLQLMTFLVGVQSSWPMVQKVLEILEQEPEVSDPLRPVELPSRALDVTLEQVTFRYAPAGRPILHRLSVQFASGRTTALVGASGSGKSTVFNLIGRLSDPEEGFVRLGGVDLRQIALDDLRHRVVRVAQHPLFIADSVRANFQLARPDATDAEIQAACEETGLWPMLVAESPRAPLNLAVPRQAGMGLSGGQRRLLAVARALLHRPAVLLLDEPTSGIDALALSALVRFVRARATGAAVIVVDHDIEGFIASVADTIHVIEGGRIIASGSHDELCRQQGLYRDLVEASRHARPPLPRDTMAVPLIPLEKR